MTKDEIISMARVSGAMFEHMNWLQRDLEPVLLRFADLVAEKERKECAKLCDAEFWLATKRDGGKAGIAAGNCAAAIRAKGQE
jgi:hypothetical protein